MPVRGEDPRAEPLIQPCPERGQRRSRACAIQASLHALQVREVPRAGWGGRGRHSRGTTGRTTSALGVPAPAEPGMFARGIHDQAGPVNRTSRGSVRRRATCVGPSCFLPLHHSWRLPRLNRPALPVAQACGIVRDSPGAGRVSRSAGREIVASRCVIHGGCPTPLRTPVLLISEVDRRLARLAARRCLLYAAPPAGVGPDPTARAGGQSSSSGRPSLCLHGTP
jgi:hypothetical protein